MEFTGKTAISAKLWTIFQHSLRDAEPLLLKPVPPRRHREGPGKNCNAVGSLYRIIGFFTKLSKILQNRKKFTSFYPAPPLNYRWFWRDLRASG